MDFQIKLYRAPDTNNHLIMIGHGPMDMQGAEQIIPAADQLLYETLNKYLEQLPNDGPRTAFLASVRNMIAETLRDGKPNLIRVARKLDVGPRTLQRRLKNHGIDFKELVDDTRYRLALTYLRDAKYTVTDTAFLLAYSEVSAFNRAFRRWTDSTPLDYRRVMAGSRRKRS